MSRDLSELFPGATLEQPGDTPAVPAPIKRTFMTDSGWRIDGPVLVVAVVCQRNWSSFTEAFVELFRSDTSGGPGWTVLLAPGGTFNIDFTPGVVLPRGAYFQIRSSDPGVACRWFFFNDDDAPVVPVFELTGDREISFKD